jgi:hypothetical protein
LGSLLRIAKEGTNAHFRYSIYKNIVLYVLRESQRIFDKGHVIMLFTLTLEVMVRYLRFVVKQLYDLDSRDLMHSVPLYSVQSPNLRTPNSGFNPGFIPFLYNK